MKLNPQLNQHWRIQLKKHLIKKKTKKQITWVNLSKLQLESCSWDNSIKRKSKQKYKAQFSINLILKDKIEKNIDKTKVKKTESTGVN